MYSILCKVYSVKYTVHRVKDNSILFHIMGLKGSKTKGTKTAYKVYCILCKVYSVIYTLQRGKEAKRKREKGIGYRVSGEREEGK